MKDRPTLLIVDDEQDMLALLRRTVAAELDWRILTAGSGEEALKIGARKPVDVILLDIKMPGLGGMEVLSRIRQEGGGPTVIMMTAYGVIELAVESIRRGAYDFVTKPFDNTRLMLTLQKAMEYHRLLNENRNLQRLVGGDDAFQGIVGRSSRMKEIFSTLQTVSGTDATVLITGESGTGKELAARAVHRLSPRRNREFVVVNCPTLPENILETELFGYVKGAFTDARADKRGLFQEAEDGTIFLDEIGEIPDRIQTKLLRVLQEKEIKPLGCSRSFKVDVRVVASTNRNLKEEMQTGKFREDLFYRLNVVNVELPPLRERREDIPLLFTHFLDRFAAEFGKEGIRPAPGLLEGLLRHAWPGNVRELENAVKRAVIMSREDRVTPAGMGLEQETPCLVTVEVNQLPYREAKEEVLNRFNAEYLSRILSEHQGNVTHAARNCGLERQALQQILRRYGIDAAAFRKE